MILGLEFHEFDKIRPITTYIVILVQGSKPSETKKLVRYHYFIMAPEFLFTGLFFLRGSTIKWRPWLPLSVNINATNYKEL